MNESFDFQAARSIETSKQKDRQTNIYTNYSKLEIRVRLF